MIVNKNIILPLFVICLLFISSCEDGAKKKLNRVLVNVAAQDGVIDNKDWDEISAFIHNNANDFSDFLTSEGALNEESVKNYIAEYFKSRRPSMDVTFITNSEPLKFKFFLERSGSMTPYDAPEGDGHFKAAIVGMLNNLPFDNENGKIYVVNSTINEYPNGIDKFIADGNVFEATKGIGNPEYTDFSAIFRNIIKNTEKNEISILVTDMIYSTQNMEGVNQSKIFAEAEGMTKSVFKGEVDDKSLLIIKMHSSYNGKYYPFNSQSGVRYDGERPYYIIVFGDKKDVARLTNDDKYVALSKFHELKGYENQYLFETSNIYKPYYSFVLSYPGISGRFRPKRGQDKQIIEIGGIEPERNNKVAQLVVAVDFNNMFIDESYLTNPANYKVKSVDSISIKSIKELDTKNISVADKKHVASASHVIVLETPSLSRDQEVIIKLINHLPDWIAKSSSDNDSNIADPAFKTTTFGLSYLLQGIYDAYKNSSPNEPYYFEMRLKLIR